MGCCTRFRLSVALIFLLFCADAAIAQTARVSSYSPQAVTVGALPGTDLNVVVSLQNFQVPPVTPSSGRRAYWGGNEAAGGIPLTIVSAVDGATQFTVAIPEALRSSPGSNVVVLCQRINFGAGAIDGACTDPGTSAQFFINPAPSFTISPLLPPAVRTVAYNAQLSVTGGTPGSPDNPYNWELVSGSYPPGLNLNEKSGVLSGTPTTDGSYAFTLRARDLYGISTPLRNFTLEVRPPLSIVTDAMLPPATTGVAYSTTLVGTGGRPGYTWSLLEGQALPPGLSLNASTGVISGTPNPSSPAGPISFTIRLGDSYQPQNQVNRTFTINVAPPLTITTAAQLPPANTSTSYSVSLIAAGGQPDYVWSLVSAGTLPQGLSLSASAGTITGTPTQAGTFNFAIRVTDQASRQATRTFTLVVLGPLTISTPAGLPEAAVGAAYSQQIQVTGGLQPYSFQVSSEALPPGITLNQSTGLLSGTPTAAGNFSFGVSVVDSQENEASRTFTVAVIGTLSITTPPALPVASMQTSYSTTLAASGGTPPYTWALVSSSTLPPGLALSASTGVISGIPSQAGEFSFIIRVTEGGAGAQASRTFTLRVLEEFRFVTTSLPDAGLGVVYPSTSLVVAGGLAPYTFSVAAQSSLPTGITLSAGGTIAGTASVAGTFTFTILATDSQGVQINQDFSLTVSFGLRFLTTSPLPAGVVGQPVDIQIAVEGGVPPYNFALVESSLPAGLSISSSGRITGTPSSSFSGSITVRVADSSAAPQTAQRDFQWEIGSPILFTTTTLPNGFINQPYSQTLQAEGGSPGYIFSLVAGSLPTGVVLDSEGALNGTPTATGQNNFTVRVADQQNQQAERDFTITVAEAPISGVGIVPSTPDPQPNTQQPVRVELDEETDTELSGSLVIDFDPETNPPVDDPAIRFVSGERTETFVVPAGTRQGLFGDQPDSPPFQTGTVAGEIQITATVRRNGVDVTPTPAPTLAVRIPAAAPVLTDLSVTRVADGLSVVVRGFSTPRAMANATLTFIARPGANISGPLSFTVDLAPAFTTWYNQEASQEHGSRFQLTLPITISGDTSEITNLSIALRNAVGLSNSLSAGF